MVRSLVAALLLSSCAASDDHSTFTAADGSDKMYNVPDSTVADTCDDATLVDSDTLGVTNLNSNDCCFYWSDWEPCQNGETPVNCKDKNREGVESASTASATTTRRATILRHPTEGGRPCPNLNSETKPCSEFQELPDCGIDCEYGEWGDWSPCTQDCGGGNTTRDRTSVLFPIDGGEGFKGARCEASQLHQTKACNTWNCDVTTNQTELCRLAVVSDDEWPPCLPQTSWGKDCVDRAQYDLCVGSGPTNDFVKCKGERNVPYVDHSVDQDRICTNVEFVHQSCNLPVCDNTAVSYGDNDVDAETTDATAWIYGEGQQTGTICGGYESLAQMDIYDERTHDEDTPGDGTKFLFMKVDTSKCGYSSTPAYVVSMVDQFGSNPSYKNTTASGAGISFFRVAGMDATSFTLIIETDILNAETARLFFETEGTRISWIADSSDVSGYSSETNWVANPNPTFAENGRSVCLDITDVREKENIDSLTPVATVISAYNHKMPRPRTDESVHFNGLRDASHTWSERSEINDDESRPSSTWSNDVSTYTKNDFNLQYSMNGPLIDAHTTFTYGDTKYYCIFGTNLSTGNNDFGVSFVNVYNSQIGGKTDVTSLGSTVVDNIDYASTPVIVSSLEYGTNQPQAPYRGAGTIRNVSKDGFEAVFSDQPYYNEFDYMTTQDHATTWDSVKVNYILAGLDCDHGDNHYNSVEIPDGATWFSGGVVLDSDKDSQLGLGTNDQIFCETEAEDNCKACAEVVRHYGDSYVTTHDDSSRPIYHLSANFLDKTHVVGDKIYADSDVWVQAQFLQQDLHASRYAGGERNTDSTESDQDGFDRPSSLWLDSGSRKCISTRMARRNAEAVLPAVPLPWKNTSLPADQWILQPAEFKPIRGWCKHPVEMACPVEALCDNNDCEKTKHVGECYGRCGTGATGGFQDFDIVITKPPVRFLQEEIDQFPEPVQTMLEEYNGEGEDCPQIIHGIQKCDTSTSVNCQTNSRPWVMSAWSEDTSCSLSCGGGTQTFTRTVVEQGNIHDQPVTQKTAVCNPQPCPIDCALGTNERATKCQGWTQCGKMDGKIFYHKDHTPAQYGGEECPAGSTEWHETCEIPCPTYTCTDAGSPSYGPCSRTCGDGHLVKTQEQEPVDPLIDGVAVDFQDLVAQDDTWSAISWTNGTIGEKWWEHFWPGLTGGTRVCPNVTSTEECHVEACPTVVDKAGTDKEIEVDGKCSVTDWSDWECDSTCEATFERRTRTATPAHCNSTEEIRDSCTVDDRYLLPCEKECTFDKWTKWSPVERTSVYTTGYIEENPDHLANVQRTRNVIANGIDSEGAELSGDACSVSGEMVQKVVWSCEALMLLHNHDASTPTLNADGIYDTDVGQCGCKNQVKVESDPQGKDTLSCQDHNNEGFGYVEYFDVYCDFLAATETTTKWKEEVECPQT